MAKRRAANGAGSLNYDEKRKLYIYRITVSYDDDGRPRRKAFSGRTQEAALEKYRVWERRNKLSAIDPDITLGEWADRWYEEYAEKVELSTAASYGYTLKHIKKYLGRQKLQSIKAFHVEAFLIEMAEAYSVSQCTKCRTMLGQILRKAEANELITKNPVQLADQTNYRRMGKRGKARKDAFTAEEVRALMRGLPDTRIGHSIRLMLGTGISTQELLGLSVFDLAPDGSRIEIRRAVKLKKGGSMYIGDVKAEQRERSGLVPPSVRASVLFLRNNADGYILAGRRSKRPLHPSTYRKFYKSAIQQVDGVRVLSPHCCRHTYISHLEDAHTDFAVIQALAGHSERKSTISYIHPQSPAIQAAVSRIEELLNAQQVCQ
jgi:integrase